MKNRKSAQRGSALIEFAMVTFLLMTVILAGIEFDRMVLVYTALGNSARAGVRYAIVHGSHRTATGDPASGPGAGNQAAVIAKVKQYASAGTLNTSTPPLGVLPAFNVLVEYPSGDNKSGSLVKVTVTYRYDPFVVLPLGVNMTSATQGIIVF
jgi:Flp pilus assembly protein TadG